MNDPQISATPNHVITPPGAQPINPLSGAGTTVESAQAVPVQPATTFSTPPQTTTQQPTQVAPAATQPSPPY